MIKANNSIDYIHSCTTMMKEEKKRNEHVSAYLYVVVTHFS